VLLRENGTQRVPVAGRLLSHCTVGSTHGKHRDAETDQNAKLYPETWR